MPWLMEEVKKEMKSTIESREIMEGKKLPQFSIITISFFSC